MYNDKSFIWIRHSEAQPNAMREKWREEIDALISQIGEHNFSAELLSELCKPDVMRDGNGVYAEKTSAWFSDLFKAN